MNLRTLPKVELHRHLEGSIRLPTAFQLAREAGVDLPADSPEALSRALQVLAPMESLEQVLAVFGLIRRLFVRESIAEQLAYEVVSDAAADNIRLLELRFSPDYMAGEANLDWDRLTESLLRGVRRASEEHGVAVGLIAIVSRSLGIDSAHRTMEYAKRWRNELVGFDLADDEVSWPSRLFEEALSPLSSMNMPLTVHSGEACGPEFVWDTLRSLNPRRLGHGVAVGADPLLIEEVRRRGVAIEVCPTSNLRTRAVPTLEAHPARRLFRAGIPISINTDDPGLFDLTLTGELEVAQNLLGFTVEELVEVQKQALHSSFLSAELKASVLRQHFGG